MADIARRFTEALQEMDRERTIEPVLGLFSENAVLERVTQRSSFEGGEGVREFWQEYLDSTRELSTSFRNVIENEGVSALEWVSEGRTADGDRLRYSGVSILEERDGKIHRFRTYFDSAAFVSNDGNSGS